ncbi:hypothetical protein KY284_024257 [Solanum tuberosum]|nr:hypothetical protein KY284_024257 [Solanum tuberosum]
MKVMKILISLAITMAFAITIITTTITTDNTGDKKAPIPTLPPLKRKIVASRFLAEQEKPKNPRAADHCHKDNEICTTLEIGGIVDIATTGA